MIFLSGLVVLSLYLGKLSPLLSLLTSSSVAIAKSTTAEMQQPAELKITYIAKNVSRKQTCDGQVKLSVSGGTLPYAIRWANGSTETSLTGLCEGTYMVTVTDASGKQLTEPIKIGAPDVSPLIIKGDYFLQGSDAVKQLELSVTIYSGVPPYSYEWSDGSSGYCIRNVSDGVYKVKVRDAARQVDTCRFVIVGKKVEVSCQYKNL